MCFAINKIIAMDLFERLHHFNSMIFGMIINLHIIVYAVLQGIISSCYFIHFLTVNGF